MDKVLKSQYSEHESVRTVQSADRPSGLVGAFLFFARKTVFRAIKAKAPQSLSAGSKSSPMRRSDLWMKR